MKKCPFCAEDIQDAAIKCKHCGEMIPSVAPTVISAPIGDASGMSSPQPDKPRPSRHPLVWVCMILGVVILIGSAIQDFSRIGFLGFLGNIIAAVVFCFLVPLAWSIGDAFRKFAHPDMYFASGAVNLAKKKLFWMIGPQMISVGIAFFIAFLIAYQFEPKKEAQQATIEPINTAMQNNQTAVNNVKNNFIEEYGPTVPSEHNAQRITVKDLKDAGLSLAGKIVVMKGKIIGGYNYKTGKAEPSNWDSNGFVLADATGNTVIVMSGLNIHMPNKIGVDATVIGRVLGPLSIEGVVPFKIIISPENQTMKEEFAPKMPDFSNAASVKARDLAVKDVDLNPVNESIVGKYVSVTGTILGYRNSDNGTYQWEDYGFFLKDDTGDVFINLSDLNITMPPKIGSHAKIFGEAIYSEGIIYIMAWKVGIINPSSK